MNRFKKIPLILAVASLCGIMVFAGLFLTASPTPKATAATPPASVTISPTEDTNPVKTQHTLTATVKTADGSAAAGAEVQWILNRFPAAVGDIVEVSNGNKVDNFYAISTTDSAGKATATITATREGDTDVTAFVPGITDANKHKVFAVKHWVDMTVDWPPDAVNKVGTDHTFSVTVSKATDGSALNGVKVRWTLSDDAPDARFKGMGSTVSSTTSTTNAAGTTSVTIQQVVPTVGDNIVTIEVMQGAKVLFKHDAKKTWLAPSLNVLKDGPTTAEINSSVEFTITVSNDGDETATGVTLVDQVPDGLTYVSATPAGTASGSKVTWNLGTLVKGASSQITAKFTAAKAGDWINKVTATSNEGITAEDTAPIEVTGAPVLAITKTGTASLTKGKQATYTITVTNNGNIAAENTVVTDTIPSGLSYTSSSPAATVSGSTVTWNAGTLAVGASKTYLITLNADTVGKYTNLAAATASNAAKVEATAPVEVVAPKVPNITITKNGASLIYLNQTGVFNITVKNTGETPLTNVVVKDTLPANLTYVSSSPSGTVSGKTVTWAFASLAVGASEDITITCRGNALGAYTNPVNVTTTEGPTDTASKSGEVTAKTGMTMQITDTTDPIAVGSQTTYQITITNQSAVTVHNTVLTVELPTGVSYVSATGATAPTVSGQTVTFAAVSTLGAGQSLSYSITVNANTAGDVICKATLTYAEFSLPITAEEGTTIYK
jgi:uncharacterized repeat protein (TIGR01451 family)